MENNIAWRVENEEEIGVWLNAKATPLSRDRTSPKSTYTGYDGNDANIENLRLLKPY